MIRKGNSYIFLIGSITACAVSDTLLVKWSLASVTNNLTAVDEFFWWSNQRNQFI